MPSHEKAISKIRDLLEAGVLPSASPWRVALLDSKSPESPDRLLQVVDASDFALEDWLASLQLLENFFQKRGMPQPKFHEALGYLECCAHSSEASLNHYALAEVVQLMLDEYGFAGDE